MIDSFLISDREYGNALNILVIACVDVVVIHDNKILLTKRREHPIQGFWWIFGGRVFKGESLKKTAQRGLNREVGLNILDESRFKEVGTFNLIWPSRREFLQENGCHHLLIAHLIEITDEEFNEIDLKGGDSEYHEWFKFEPNRLFLPELIEVISKSKQLVSISK